MTIEGVTERVAEPKPRRGHEPEWPVWLMVGVALLLGLSLQAWAMGRTETVSEGAVTLTYPASWSLSHTSGDELFTAIDRQHGGVFAPQLAVQRLPREMPSLAGAGPVSIATTWSIRRARDLSGYRALSIEPTTVAGREAARIDYGYLDAGPMGSASGAMPGLMRAIDTIVSDSQGYLVITVAAEHTEFSALTEPRFPRSTSVYDDIIRGVRVS